MTLTLTVYTALWTPEDVAHGANDPEKTTSETLTFVDVDELVAYLHNNELTEPSSWPVTGNEQRVWFSQASRILQPHEFEEDRHERTAHRGDDVPDDAWIVVVRAVVT